MGWLRDRSIAKKADQVLVEIIDEITPLHAANPGWDIGRILKAIVQKRGIGRDLESTHSYTWEGLLLAMVIILVKQALSQDHAFGGQKDFVTIETVVGRVVQMQGGSIDNMIADFPAIFG